MDHLISIFETYFVTLVHPFRIHQEFRYKLPINGYEGHTYEPLTLAEAIGVSWIFAILRGLCKIIILNFFLQSLLDMQSDRFPVLQALMKESGVSTYYFLLFSAALDIIFFPVGAMVMTGVWAWVIRLYSKWLNPDRPHEEISEQITTHALSSNVFTMVPILGDFIQPMLYYFLLYAGLRSNLGTSRSLAWVILLTPTLFLAMVLSTLAFIIFYLVQ